MTNKGVMIKEGVSVYRKERKETSCSVVSFQELLERFPHLSIPEYQRAYRWEVSKVDDLLSDLEEFVIKGKVDEYYMGMILLYDNHGEDRYEIIDGQQRLTTLLLMKYVMEGELKAGGTLKYNSHVSEKSIRRNVIYLKEKREDLLKLERENVFDRLRFTVVVCDEEDHAFSFFDSQNNRGVTLSVDDYLKAYHLRAVSLEVMQERFAQYWEGVSLLSQKMGNEELGWSYLFYKVLFRARRWKGNECVLVDDKEKVLEVFQKDTRRNLENDTYPLFQNKSNQRFRKVVVTRSGEACLVPELTGKEGVELPYCLRQPLYKGHNFFEYARKYCCVYQLLFGEGGERRGELAVAVDFYERVYTNDMSVFLRHFMKLCLVMYYDVFGEEGIGRAVQYFDYFIGSIRLEMQYVKKEAVKNSLIWRGHNLLDVIAGAYIPEEVFHFIRCEGKCKEIYNREDVPEKDGVRFRYKKRVLAYYRKEGGLQNRLSWIK